MENVEDSPRFYLPAVRSFCDGARRLTPIPPEFDEQMPAHALLCPGLQ